MRSTNTQKILQDLIRFKTVTGNQTEVHHLFKYVKAELKGLPVFFTEFTSNKFPSLLITTHKTKTPDIWLAAHVDVVAGSPSVFVPKITAGKLWGRGAFDMKFALACYLRIFQELGKDLKSHNLGIMLTSDEEIGGMNGVKILLDKGFASKICILPDGGDFWRLEKAAKGVWHVHLESSGKSAHASRPWEGHSATEQLVQFLAAVRKEIFNYPYKPGGEDLYPTFNIGVIGGGKIINQIADHAEALIDIRFFKHSDFERIDKRLRVLGKRFPQVKITERIFADNFALDWQHPTVKLFARTVADYTDDIVKPPIIAYGSSDARFFCAKGIPAIVVRPNGGGHHSEHEWIDLKDLETFKEVIKEYIQRFSRLNPQGSPHKTRQ